MRTDADRAALGRPGESRSTGDAPGTTNKRLELGARSRDEILNAALRTMALYGYDGTSISRIAAESGLPASSIYWHFNSKAGVLAAVMQRGADRFFAFPFDEMPKDPTPRDAFREELRIASRSVHDNPEFLRLLFLLVLGSGPDDGVVRHARAVAERGKRRLRSAIERAYAEHGPAVATEVADGLVDFAQASFDGLFLATQSHDGLTHPGLIDPLVDAVLALGDAMVARRTA